MIREVELRRTVSICNRQGLHARPCHALVSIASEFPGELRVSCGDHEVNGKSILELMTLNASQGSVLEICARGEGAREILDRMEELVRSGFGESGTS